MKKLITLTILAFSLWSHAQNGITYQAVILNPNTEELPGVDNSRMPLVNQSICLEFKIINAASKVDYQETLNTRTDEYGMVNVIIGTGTRKAGIATQFSAINWDGSAKSLIVSLDPTDNCSDFIEISDQPFTYVPFALYAANSGKTGPAGINGIDGKTVLNGTTNPLTSIGSNGDFYINTATYSLFGPKTNDVWGNGVSLIGPQGIQGNAGSTGSTGPQGTAGTNGVNGQDGLSAYQIWLNAGNTGTEAQFLTALRGETGAQGPQGIAGANGSNGPQGPTGPAGSDGQNGLSAYQIWLNAGNTGTEAQFLTALRGATGTQGPQGIQGVAGPTGATGPQGTAGTNGANGTNGNNGLSAYQIWLNAGNIGTEAQFLTALRGATGAQGSQGANGQDGATWLSGNTSPNTNIGSINDFYLNTTNGEYFKKTAANLWTLQGNLTGPAGAQGTSNSNGTANSIYWFKEFGVTNSYVECNIIWSVFKYTTGFSSNNDVIHDSTTGEITFTKSGVYKIEYFVPGGGNFIFQGIQLLNYKNTTWNTLTGIYPYRYQEFRANGIVLSVSAGEKIKIRVDGNAYEISVIISETGVTGPQGIAGTNGTNGTNGVNGQDGLSAYQIWLNAGNTGTEAQFLTALRGATGAQGPQGVAGIAGPAGSTGPQGIAGTNGANGLDGKTILNGNQDPINSVGNNGDFYINTTTNLLFGPKTSGAWGSGIALVGPQGAAGTNGKNTLVNTTTEAAGANCANGGTKIEVGLDTNSNGVLDISEVNSSLTKYVCNGVSSNNTGGSSNLVHGMVTLNTIGQSINWVVPNDVYTIEIHVNGSNGGKGGDALYVGCGGIEKYGGTGGVYGSAKVNLNVVPGDVITYYLGLNGTPGNDACNYGYGAVAMNGSAGETSLIYKNSILGMKIVGGNGGTRAVSSGNGSAGSNGYLNMSGLLNNGFFAEEKANPYSNQKQTIIIRY